MNGVVEMLIGYADEMSSQDVSCLAEWADYHAKGTPNCDWRRAYALIREGADLLLRRRALIGFNPEYEPPVQGPNLLTKQSHVEPHVEK
jgi:hypothetical protein